MHIAIVENTRVTQHGQVGVALHERAATIDLYKPWIDGRLPAPGSFDALVVFGGEQSAVDDAIHPYLPDLAALMATAARQDMAVLGVCLGAQILARGLGAENRLGQARETGWCQVTRLAQDPVLDAVPQVFPIFQMHSDTFTLPPDTAHLAASAAAPVQCFRAGRAGYGMQFHFEASVSVAREWTRRFGRDIEAMAPGWAQGFDAQARALGAKADAHGLAIARAWVDLVRG